MLRKREPGIDILTDLEILDFSGEELEVGLEWTLRNKDQLELAREVAKINTKRVRGGR